MSNDKSLNFHLQFGFINWSLTVILIDDLKKKKKKKKD